MSSGRITWLTERWSRGTIVEALPRLRARYGDAVGGAVELTRALLEDEIDQPRGQDVRRTLEAIEERGRAAELDGLDVQTDCELLRESWRAFGTDRYDLLPDEGLRQIARAALEAFDRPAGARPTDRHAVSLVTSLLRLWRQREAVELKRIKDRRERRGRTVNSEEQRRDDKVKLNKARLRMLSYALREAGIKAGPKNIERLITEAGKVL